MVQKCIRMWKLVDVMVKCVFLLIYGFPYFSFSYLYSLKWVRNKLVPYRTGFNVVQLYSSLQFPVITNSHILWVNELKSLFIITGVNILSRKLSQMWIEISFLTLLRCQNLLSISQNLVFQWEILAVWLLWKQINCCFF